MWHLCDTYFYIISKLEIIGGFYMKKTIIKSIGLSLACLLGVGSAISLSLRGQPIQRVDAGTGPTYSITQAQAYGASGTSYSIFSWWGGADWEEYGTKWNCLVSKSGEFISAYHDNLNSASKVTVKINFVSCDSTDSPKIYLVVDYSKQSSKKTLSKGNNTITWNLPTDVAQGEDIAFCFDYPNATSSGMNYLYFNGFDANTPIITIETNDSSRAVSISAATGVKSVYLSKTSTATSGSASGTKFNDGDTVYGFAELAAGYKHPSGWTKVSGTDDTEGAKYRVGSITVSKTTTSISYTAPTAKTKTLARNGNGATSGSNVTLTYGQAASVPALSRTGYSFTGWNTNSSGTGTSYSTSLSVAQVNSLVLGSTSTFYAQWSANQYTVTLNKNSGTGGSNSVTAKYDSAMPSISLPSRTGYTFMGYYDTNAATGGNQYYTSTGASARSWNKTANTTLYARWTPIQYSIYYFLNGGQVESPNPTAYTIETDSFTLNNPTRFGYEFKGWYGDDIVGYQTNVTIAKGTYGNKVYRAAWEYLPEIQNVVDKISDIGGVESVSYPSSKAAINGAREAYDDLSPEYQEVIADLYGTLIDEETEYNDQRNTAISNAVTAIENIGDVAEVSYPESREVLFAAEAAVANLDEDDRKSSVVSNYQNVLDARSKYDTQKEAAVEATKQAIEEIGETVSYPESKQAIENAESLYNALAPEEQDPSIITNSDWLFDAREQYDSDREDKIDGVQDAIDAIAKPFDANRENQIQNAQDLFDALDESDKNSEIITNLGELNDAKAADAVAALIEELPTYTDPNEFINAVKAADDAFNALSNNQKAFINEDLLKSLNDYINACGTVELIEAIGDVTYHGGVDDSLEAIVAAENSYNDLSGDQQLIVDAINHDVLLHAREVYDDVKEVVDMIDSISLVVQNPESKELIFSTKEAYDALSDEEKALIYNYDKLYTAYAAIEDLIDCRENADNAMALINAIGEVSYPDSQEAIETARKAYDELDGYEKSLVTNYSVLLEAEEKYENLKNEAMAEAVDALINAIGEVEYTSQSKAKIDAARNAYEALTPEQKALVEKLAVLEAAEARYAELKADNEAADAVDALINAIGEVEYTSQSKAKIDAARNAYEVLTPAQKALVDNLAVLEAAEARYAELKADNEAADAVDALIKAIGEVKYPSSKEAIEAARNAYQALTPAQKALVDKLAVLEAAEARYAQLKADNEAADAVDTLILAIGKVEYTSQSKAKIDAARNAYQALTQEQKALVDNLSILEAAEAAYAKLKADNEAADAVDALIEKIGNVQYPGSKEAIDEARAAYEALTPEQKALVEKLGVLTEAEQTYQNLHQQAETTKTIVIACSIGGGVLLLGGIILILVLVKKGNKKEEEKENKQSK